MSKSVDNPVPVAPQQTIEFTIELRNIGSATALDVVAKDQLPAGLEIPDGMAAFTSHGYFDVATGTWNVGQVLPDELAVLTIPVVVNASPQPPCIINSVSIVRLTGPEADASNNESATAVTLPGIDSCADVYLASRIFLPIVPHCGGGAASIGYSFVLKNRGPDDARNVVLKLEETSEFKLPGFRFVSEGCSLLECRWESFPAYTSITAIAESAEFKHTTERTHAIRLAITSPDDHGEEDNVYFISRAIKAFNIPCPDYGLPDQPIGIGGGGGGGGCLIASAAYESPLDYRVDILREFRDQWLSKFTGGQNFIAFYYRHSPAIADYIRPRPWLRAIVRGSLVPVLALIEYPIPSLSVALLFLGLVVYQIKRRRSQSIKTSP